MSAKSTKSVVQSAVNLNNMIKQFFKLIKRILNKKEYNFEDLLNEKKYKRMEFGSIAEAEKHSSPFSTIVIDYPKGKITLFKLK